MFSCLFKLFQFSNFWKSCTPAIFFQFSIGMRVLCNALEQLSHGKKLKFLKGQAYGMLRSCQLGDIYGKEQRRSERFAEKEGLYSGKNGVLWKEKLLPLSTWSVHLPCWEAQGQTALALSWSSELNFHIFNIWAFVCLDSAEKLLKPHLP